MRRIIYIKSVSSLILGMSFFSAAYGMNDANDIQDRNLRRYPSRSHFNPAPLDPSLPLPKAEAALTVQYACTIDLKEGAKVPFQAKIIPLSSDLREEEEGFKISFSGLYASFTAVALLGEERTEILGGPDVAKEKWLEASFQEEREVLGTPGIFHVRLETMIGKLIGCFSVEEWDLYDKKPADFPPNSLYIRQLYILPSFQKQGIGRVAMSSLLRSLRPNAQHVYLATRRINEGARTLYESLGFNERRESLHGLPSEKYISYELHLDTRDELHLGS